MITDVPEKEVAQIKTYIVRENDNLAKIATKQGHSVGELAEKNKLDSFKLQVGQELVF
ncbi:LysM peptidoglycan-binding domain-containing protein [Listeria ivanovii]|nr:LysM peptidoglycan-binding domain-containing protein [Listeria ivanovii]MBK3915594.1 LysM peptidoglycan-binding domain-containing protein [Listeria ivanovii subsp. ivanovii]MBC2256015.1 LysM peptidoglycan-binding domain-containing protein [Listeria ivanovii]MBK3922729.1 LysM peptidoglycan-binding domain-containing protein [Listeria ivanovii subsp. ivanovii]MBK3927889.1 LysM peptidoglycan-binding domain-containing protein [Listeria ivanovii subsp. ivanovii]